ncbi:PilZ domain-containing protein [Halomonas sp. McH1-25]|uniref:HD domain-containing phosphohydrolase n=1 Tax=unclassified Halomonas TaxID=2609666 RepID=UPI001EF5B1A4|nr:MULTISPECIES: HD domain-containing phosphohydrolase [unclassified Halomonas]MCG7600357.1 PilZ domain-containing protein [Halomonas sp. McH1-25]MCP1344232.1 PilZ domain-containing protein [Halomonas sp. FL8]MCP1361483.1 PilZ domain-containing protein [Halomonas sp. BBD45]MCP1364984.1 PilZ domain-containing protein [Halomonas sp. BBD48]
MNESPSTVEHAGEIAKLVEAMSQPGGVSLSFEEHGTPVSVLLVEVLEDRQLVLDISAVPEIAGALMAERPFRLTGQAHGAMISTEPLTALPLSGTPGRLQFSCGYPSRLDVWHRRNAFRAELGPGMTVAVELELDAERETVYGELVNLSLGGCLAQLPLNKAAELKSGQRLTRLEAVFPSGQRLAAQGRVRHVRIDEKWQRALVGCEFDTPSPKLERWIWFLVKEIEREAVRKAAQGEKPLDPSELFRAASAASQALPARRLRADYATPMARRLAKIADFLNAQLVQLQHDGALDRAQLSRYSDMLLGLLEEDREALVFASVCLHHEPQLVQHGLAVAIRLADLAKARRAPRELLKAIVATAMVHDLGKAMLDDALRNSSAFDAAQRERLSGHVALIRDKLEACRWLSPQVVRSVAGEINERLDGSGYPNGLQDSDLPELSRMAMVVDVVDAMTRQRPDRPAWSLEDTYRHMLGRPGMFDREWVQHYIRHFGRYPIGSLVRFSSGAQGWVQRLDSKGQPRQIAVISPTSQLRLDGEVRSLGAIEEILRAPLPELLPRQ